ncbi:hypothetical protein [Ensifer sp. LCM 4579]|uniref:hypothetical protein n=1 Tax=Ensifer sp. LCM 4579 TaxID=1848292 RepID=UPI0008D8EE4F|nr:hypothetical protein [Ensifer sp. LCM 4579]OHV80314.1 hypothetical protein LCM4579_22240 [Ensifer sp. LCM 4579]
MQSYLEAKIELSRMEAACCTNCRHLKIIDRQIRAEAERMTIRNRNKVRQFGRHASTWTNADERHYRDCLDAAYETRRTEVEALRRKIERQAAAINRLRACLGINEPVPDIPHMISG